MAFFSVAVRQRAAMRQEGGDFGLPTLKHFTAMWRLAPDCLDILSFHEKQRDMAANHKPTILLIAPCVRIQPIPLGAEMPESNLEF